MRTTPIALTLLVLLPQTVRAQSIPPIPFEASVGLGGVIDRVPSQSSLGLTGGLSWDYDANWWAVMILEGEVGPTSDVDACRNTAAAASEACMDAALLAGFRFRRSPHASTGLRPFAQILAGQYWKGSGTFEQSYVSEHFALQVGGGLEFRWRGSFQGMRVSADLRRVFAGQANRTQFRIAWAYVIGPRRFKD